MNHVRILHPVANRALPVRTALAVLAVLLHGAAAIASAQETTLPFSIAGFGEVGFGKTNRNTFLTGTKEGNYANSHFGVVLNAPLSERVSVSTLVQIKEGADGMRGDIAYAFATLRLSRSVDLRIGKVKHPGSLYGEVIDIGTVRPFLNLPQSIYGGTGSSVESYTGAGVNGTVFLGSWAAAVAAYAGGGLYDYQSIRLQLLPGVDAKHWRLPVRNLAGARVSLRPPIPGLSVGLSGHRALASFCPDGVPTQYCSGDLIEHQWSGQAEYLTDRIWLRSEYAHLRAGEVFATSAYYVEGAYFLTSHWQVAAQYNNLSDKALSGPASVPLPAALDEHRETAFGLNYWLTTGVVLKGSVHHVSGNRFAVPNTEELMHGLATGVLPSRTRLLQAGLQFSF